MNKNTRLETSIFRVEKEFFPLARFLIVYAYSRIGPYDHGHITMINVVILTKGIYSAKLTDLKLVLRPTTFHGLVASR